MLIQKHKIMNTYYSFREVKNTEELKALFHLRYQEFLKCRLNGFIEKNKYELDIDCYDLRARHFGLFCCTQHGEVLVGCMRVIDNKPTYIAEKVLKIASLSKLLFQKVNQTPKHPFPLMNYNSHVKELNAFYQHLKIKNEKLCEVGRFVFSTEIRSLCLAKFVVECAMAVYYSDLGFENAIISCYPLHKRLYGLYGFKEFSDGKSFTVNGTSQLIMSLSFNKDVPFPLKEEVAKKSTIFKETRSICFHPSIPEYFSPPKEVRLTPMSRSIGAFA